MIGRMCGPWIRQVYEILPKHCVIENPNELAVFNEDWTRVYRGRSRLAVSPSTTQELSALMRVFNENRVKVVPQGGRTGLVGGGVPVDDEVILLMKNFRHIRRFDEVTSVVTVDAGCILSQVNSELARFGCMLPWDLGARGSC